MLIACCLLLFAYIWSFLRTQNQIFVFILFSNKFTSCLHIVPPVWLRALLWCDSCAVVSPVFCIQLLCLRSILVSLLQKHFVSQASLKLLVKKQNYSKNLNRFSIVCQVLMGLGSLVAKGAPTQYYSIKSNRLLRLFFVSVRGVITVFERNGSVCVVCAWSWFGDHGTFLPQDKSRV